MKKRLFSVLLTIVALLSVFATSIAADDTSNANNNSEQTGYAHVLYEWSSYPITNKGDTVVNSFEELKQVTNTPQRFTYINIDILQDNVVIPCEIQSIEMTINANGHPFTFEGEDVLIDGHYASMRGYQSMDGNQLPTVRRLIIQNANFSNSCQKFIVDWGCEIRFENCVFDGQNQNRSKPIVEVRDDSTVTFKDTIIKNFVMTGNDGVIGIGDIKSDEDEHGIYINGENSSIEYCKGSNGSAIHTTNNNNLQIKGMSFKHNSATNDGGAIYAYHGTLESCYFLDNSATNCGGAVFGGINVTECTFEWNSAVEDGGALYMDKEHMEIASSTFSNNTSGEDGGAICAYQDYSEINHCSFNNNEAHSDGGAVYVCFNTYDIIMNYCSFKNDFASSKGNEVVGDIGTELHNCSVENTKGEKSVPGCDYYNTTFSGTGSILSNGNIWIIIGIVGILVLVMVILYKRKKQTA